MMLMYRVLYIMALLLSFAVCVSVAAEVSPGPGEHSSCTAVENNKDSCLATAQATANSCSGGKTGGDCTRGSEDETLQSICTQTGVTEGKPNCSPKPPTDTEAAEGAADCPESQKPCLDKTPAATPEARTECTSTDTEGGNGLCANKSEINGPIMDQTSCPAGGERDKCREAAVPSKVSEAECSNGGAGDAGRTCATRPGAETEQHDGVTSRPGDAKVVGATDSGTSHVPSSSTTLTSATSVSAGSGGSGENIQKPNGEGGPAAPAPGAKNQDSQIIQPTKDTTQAEGKQTTGPVTGDGKETSTTPSHNNQAENGTGEANNVANTNSDTPRIQTPVTQDSQSSNGTGDTNNSANTNTDSDTPNTPSNKESTSSTTTTTTTTTLPPVPANNNKKPDVKGDADSSSSMSSVWVRVSLLIVVALACILV